jgi:membrane protease subunit (stomatin/prohibitin family)
MGIFGNADGGVMDVIRCDEPDYLIWKWHPTGTSSQGGKRTNAIRWGSSLRVRDGSVAVFVY